jgi:phenylalanyl-tRNA synthetase beta chain
MKILLSLLEQMIDLKKYSKETIVDMLTNIGFEVNSFEKIKDFDFYKALVVGEVLSCKQHPNADRLKITQINIGDDHPLFIVCGAPNVREGIKVVVAKDNTTLRPFNGEQITIKRTKIRGELSEGMLCAEDEIGLSANHEKIIEVDHIYTPGTTLDKIFTAKDDYVFDIELTPNRSYAASHIGLAKDIAAKISYIENKKISILDTNTCEIDQLPRIKNFTVNISDANLCRRYCGMLCGNVSVKPSKESFQEKIKSLGIKPINNIVDITNFVMFMTGQPIHAYDFNKITGDVSVKLSTGDFITTLNNEKYITQNDIVVGDKDKNLCLAGVIGCQSSVVSPSTKSVFFESAAFNSINIYCTAKRLSIQTEASRRFGHDIDSDNTWRALQYVYDLLKENEMDMSFLGTIDINNSSLHLRQIYSSMANIGRIIGDDIPPDTINNIFAALEIKIVFIDADKFIATIPSYRNYIQCEADLAEEVLRIYGYENLKSKDYFSFLCKANDNTYEAKNQFGQHISVVLAAKGFYEIKTNSLMASVYGEECDIRLLNAASNNAEILRQSMILSELNVISDNISHGNKNLKLFEIGKIYKTTTTRIQEEQHLSLLFSGALNDCWYQEARTVGGMYVKNVISDIFSMFNLTDISYCKKILENILVKYDNKVIATIGKVHDNLLLQYNITQDVFYGDIDLDLLFDAVQNKKCVEYKTINNLQVVKRDLSLILEKHVKFSDIEKVIYGLHEKNIIDFKLFSVFVNNEDKKTYSLSFYLQNSQKNLDSSVIQRIMDRLMQAFITQVGAEIKQ